MIQKSIFRINELTSEQVNKLLLQSLLTRLLVNLSTRHLIPTSMKSGFFEDYKRQRGEK